MTNWNSSLQIHGMASSDDQGKLIGSVASMPSASADYLGVALLYIGATSSDYTNNTMYVCEADGTSYKWAEVSGGAGGMRYYLTVTVTIGGTAATSGIPVSVQGVATGTTNGGGQYICTVPEMTTYTVEAGDGVVYAKSSTTVTITGVMNTVSLDVTANPTVAIAGGLTGVTWSPLPLGEDSGTYYIDASTEYTLTPPPQEGYYTPASQTISPTHPASRTVTFTYSANPVLTVVQTGATGTVTITGGDYNDLGGGQYRLTSAVGTVYTIAVSDVSGYATPASQTYTAVAGGTPTKTFAYGAYPVLTVNQVNATGTVTITGGTYEDIGSSQYRLTSPVGTTYTISVSEVAGYTVPASQTYKSVAGATVTKTFTYLKRPTVTITLVDDKSSTSSVTVTASKSGQTDISKTFALGSAETFTLPATGSWKFTMTGMPSGGMCDAITASTSSGGTYSKTMTVYYPLWEGLFKLSYDSTKISTDPTGCLTYAEDLAGLTPIENTSTTLATATNYATSGWYMKADGTSDNPLLNACFYATFDSSGNPHEKLNPNDLSKKIATWNSTTKKWVSATGSSSITTENTLFCIPTVYTAGFSSYYRMSSKPSEGTAYAHTIDGHKYQYLGIGVYLGYNNSSKLMSLSGKTATTGISVDDFRTYAHNNSSSIGQWMQWNYWQWSLLRMMIIMSIKSFQSQGLIGQGGASAATTGVCNSMGAFAGNISGTTDHEKAFIEDFWGVSYQYVDDVKYLSDDSKVHAGQHASGVVTSSDTVIFSGMTSPDGFALTIATSNVNWGIGNSSGGSKTTGTCDDCTFPNSSSPYMNVGGCSYEGYDGVSCIYRNDGRGVVSYGRTARLAYVFDI